ncbi:MAG TPA: class I SAM-dependent RNA methyltransferase [Candidatus Binataceae bacterium]|nr:class I SAM-dependent RNA methyltransferase [Candidatus Binataceae bacterium]
MTNYNKKSGALMDRLLIETMTLGPYGIARLDGNTVMVPRVAPGDLVEVEIDELKRSHALARLARVVQPGRDRRAAPCPYQAQCGGCDWQQIAYAAQLELKSALLAAEFRRALGVPLPRDGLVQAAPAEFGYRARIRLGVGRNGELGYHELSGRHLVPIASCLISEVELTPAVPLARLLRGSCREIELVKKSAQVVLIARLARGLSASDRASIRRILEQDANLAGVICSGAHGRELIGDCAITFSPEPGCDLTIPADCFTQVNRLQNQRLVATVMELARPEAGMTVLDLYCGVGNFTFPATRRGATVLGVDADPIAISAARANATRSGLPAEFIAMPADETAEFLKRAHYRPDIVLMDPPRGGAAKLLDALAQLRPTRIFYVSCEPHTLIRDLARLQARQYQITRVQAFDLFPNTHHLETVVQLDRLSA